MTNKDNKINESYYDHHLLYHGDFYVACVNLLWNQRKHRYDNNCIKYSRYLVFTWITHYCLFIHMYYAHLQFPNVDRMSQNNPEQTQVYHIAIWANM